MTPENNYNSEETESYQSVNQAQIEAARTANNTWVFEEKEREMYVANGETLVATAVIDRTTKNVSGTVLIHNFKWIDEKAFSERENSFVTTMRRVGRSNDQLINTTHNATVNAKLYASLVSGGAVVVPLGNGQTTETEKTRDEMLEFARIYPEAASEAIETWLESAHFEIVEDSASAFDWMFTSGSTIKIKWWIGDKDEPLAAGYITFKSPVSEERKRHDDEVQNIKSRRQGEINIAEMSENFGKKLAYGLKHLLSVEGIAIGSEGVVYNEKLKRDFVIKFNPIWFVQAVELMHESFDFTKGKSAKS